MGEKKKCGKENNTVPLISLLKEIHFFIED